MAGSWKAARPIEFSSAQDGYTRMLLEAIPKADEAPPRPAPLGRLC
jgi:hypothetical protein